MVNSSKVLILDDESLWLDSLEINLQKGGFKTISTQSAQKAIELCCHDKSIKFALIDEILYEDGELQQPQGKGVIQEIRKHRHDIQFIVVTSAPLNRSQGNSVLLLEESSKLEQNPGVKRLLHKYDIHSDRDPEARKATYESLYRLLETPRFQPPYFLKLIHESKTAFSIGSYQTQEMKLIDDDKYALLLYRMAIIVKYHYPNRDGTRYTPANTIHHSEVIKICKPVSKVPNRPEKNQANDCMNGFRRWLGDNIFSEYEDHKHLFKSVSQVGWKLILEPDKIQWNGKEPEKVEL